VDALIGVEGGARSVVRARRLPRTALDLPEDAVELDAAALDAPALVVVPKSIR
jgi:hypothetical protein